MTQVCRNALVAALVCALLLQSICDAAPSKRPPPKRSRKAPPPKRSFRPPPRTKPASPALNFVVFGDSLSDNGNSKRLYGLPLDAYYYEGRFSNGPNWVDYVGKALGSNSRVYNYATSGGAVCRDQAFPPYLSVFPNLDLGFDDQVKTFLADLQANKISSRKSVAVIWLGNNDWVTKLFLNASAVNQATVISTSTRISGCFTAGIQKLLATNSFSHIYVSTLGPIEGLPLLLRLARPFVPLVKQLVDVANLFTIQTVASINAELAKLPQTPASPVVGTIDLTSILRERTVRPIPGVNVTEVECLFIDSSMSPQPQVGTRCTNPENYNYWDDLHPTTRVHGEVIAPFVLDKLRADKVIR